MWDRLVISLLSLSTEQWLCAWCAFQLRQITGVNFQQWCPLIYNVLGLLRGGGGRGGFTLKEVRILNEWELAGYVPWSAFEKTTHRLEEKHSPVITAPLRVLKKASLRLYKQDDGKNNLNRHRTN